MIHFCCIRYYDSKRIVLRILVYAVLMTYEVMWSNMNVIIIKKKKKHEKSAMFVVMTYSFNLTSV